MSDRVAGVARLLTGIGAVALVNPTRLRTTLAEHWPGLTDAELREAFDRARAFKLDEADECIREADALDGLARAQAARREAADGDV